MMAGTASLPHVLMRYFTTPSVKSARQSVAWSLLFIFLLYFTAPALATFTKLQLLDPNLATGIIGKSIADVEALTWIQKWSNVGFLQIIDANGDGILQLNEFFMRTGIVVGSCTATSPRTPKLIESSLTEFPLSATNLS